MASGDDEFEYMLLQEYATCPTRATPGSAGFDVYSPGSFDIPPRDTATIPLYIAIKPPEGMYIRITSRSGLAIKSKIFCCADVVDPDYTGGLHVCLFNASKYKYNVKQHERIGSIVFERYGIPSAKEVDTMQPTTRGLGGFGSTGI